MRDTPESSRMIIAMLYERYRRARELKANAFNDPDTKTGDKNMLIAAEAEAWNTLQVAKQIVYDFNENRPRNAEGSHAFLKIIGLRGLIKKRKANNRKSF